MTLKLTLLAAATALAATFPPLTRADVLWDNGPAIGTGNEFQTLNCSGPACGAGWTLYDDFTLAVSATVTGLSYASQFMRADYGLGDPPLAGYLGSRWSIWTADPATHFGEGPIASGITRGALSRTGDYYAVVLEGLDLELGAGRYWLGLQNALDDTLITSYVPAEGWQALDPALQLDEQGGPGAAWTPAASFAVHGTVAAVPEAETWALLAAGLAAVGLARRSGRRRETA